MTLSITIQEQDLTILTKCVNLSCMKQGLAVMQEAGVVIILTLLEQTSPVKNCFVSYRLG